MPLNNVTRFLEARQIPHSACELPPEKLGAAETARLLNVPPALVFKTIVVTRAGTKKPLLALLGRGTLSRSKRGLPLVIASSAREQAEVGGLSIRLPVETLARLTNAHFAASSRFHESNSPTFSPLTQSE